jgi:AcrR family transcriptional regulator
MGDAIRVPVPAHRAAMDTAPRPPDPARRPRQARSRDTEERILRALSDLLRNHPFDRLSVSQIAARAGVSVGGFYARFPSKHDALLHLSYEAYVAETTRAAAEALDPARWRGLGIAPVAAAYFRLIVESTRRHHALIRELVHRARARGATPVAEDAHDRFAATVLDPFRALLLERAAEIRHPDPALAVRVGFSACQSALREALLCPTMRPTMGEIADDQLAAEITRMLCRYLGADDSA